MKYNKNISQNSFKENDPLHISEKAFEMLLLVSELIPCAAVTAAKCLRCPVNRPLG